MVELTSQQRFDLWDQFIKTWPIEKLKELTLEEYNTLGSKNSFCYWLERKTEDLGSIRGRSAFKFGVFEFDPNSKNAKEESTGVLKDSKYKWLKKYGSSANEAFEKIKSIIIAIAEASANGDFAEIDDIDLGHATKWKIAFLYQERENPQLVCVYKREKLLKYTGCSDKKTPTSGLYAKIREEKPMHREEVFTFSRDIWTSMDEIPFAPDIQFFVCSAGQPGKEYTEGNFQKCIEQKAHIMHEGTKSDLRGDFDAVQENDVILLKYDGKIVAWGKTTGTVAPNDGTEEGWNNKIYVDEWHFYSDDHIGGPGIYGIKSACVTGTINYAVVRQVTPKWAISKLKDFSNSGDLLASFKAESQIQEKENEVSKMDNAKIPYTLNTIFYGPPGTGKTRILLNEIAEKYFYEKVGQLTEAERNANVVADLNWWEVIALCLLDNGDSAKVPKIMEHPLIAAHLKNSMSNNPSSAVWGQLQIHTKEDCEHVKYDLARRADPKVFSKSQDSTWAVDRDLITAIRPDLLERLKQYRIAIGVSEIKRYQFITFHQSYSYENFVEGISAETDDNGNIHYDIKPGIFWTFCQKAQNDPDHKYALFIDEINRGNVSGVFGELISLIESDKRAKLHITLPYSKKDFYVPENLYIFGSMNTADRSIDALDSALRRRFAFVEMPPKPELLSSDEFKPKHISVDLCALLKALNRRVEFLLDRDHKIGHSYFMTIQAETAENELANLQASFKNQIIPLLEDYFYGNLEKVQMVLGRKFIVPDEEQELTSACLMCGEDAVEFQDKVSLKVADLSTLNEADFAELIK